MKDTRTQVTQDAAVRLMLKFPYWSELYYTMTIFERHDIPTLCTDGRNMWVNPKFWATLTLELKIAALAHEVGHKMLLHCSRRGARHPMLWNIAADYVVNAILKKNGFQLGEGWLFDPKYDGWAVEAIYHDLEQQAQQQPQGGGSDEQQEEGKSETQGDTQGQPGGDQDAEDGDSGGDGTGSGDGGNAGSEGDAEGDGSAGAGGNAGGGGAPSTNFDVPGVSQKWKDMWQDINDMQGSAEQIDKAEKEVLEAVEKAILTAQAHGNMPGGMEGFDNLMKPSREPWYNHLHRFMQSLSTAEYNWKRINRRHLVQHGLFTPDNITESLEHVVFAIDTSGSVFDKQSQAGFAGHVNAILAETKPKHTHVVYFDAKVQRHDELEYGALEFSTRPKGGGGTDFRPIFEYLEEEGIVADAVIVLTDCYGDFPDDEPPYPVLWASIVDPKDLGHYHPPFGEVVHVSDDH
jgi:predicted metal-dependent peptidase